MTLTTEELEKRGRDWAEIFFGVIPEDMLSTCYIRAEQNPDRRQEDKNFPLRRREVLDAYYRLIAGEPTLRITECEFCRLHKKDPKEYLSCPFHRSDLARDNKPGEALQIGEMWRI